MSRKHNFIKLYIQVTTLVKYIKNPKCDGFENILKVHYFKKIKLNFFF